MEQTSPGPPKESTETRAAASRGNPDASDSAAKRKTSLRAQSSTPAQSRGPFRTRSSRNAILPASENACARGPLDTKGRLFRASAHWEKRPGARPCFPITSRAENEIAATAPEGQSGHRDKAPSWEADSPGLRTEAPT